MSHGGIPNPYCNCQDCKDARQYLEEQPDGTITPADPSDLSYVTGDDPVRKMAGDKIDFLEHNLAEANKEIAELKEKVAMYEGDDIPVVPQDKYLRLREIASSQDKGIERLKKQNTNLKSQVKLWKMRLEEAIKLYKKDGE